ncbi:NDR1/HIN1-like protein 6 [Diospyros lotus]|uniref:NDR1/HIN1-like protein 6 n=1 Tax=Diospyros lotus TaxID=55363 RepID=UPI002258E951|nr:NDR1/HIN1-like protein 6 [Diospyros lotus]
MTERERVYPSSKPNGTTPSASTAGGSGGRATNPPSFPAPKSQLYNPNRHPFRPQASPPRRRRRSRLCLCCFWSTLLLIFALLLAAIAGCVFYLLYSPRRPSFSATTLRLSRFNLSTSADDDTSHLAAALNISFSAKNPNKKIMFLYGPISIVAFSNEVLIGNGSFPGFASYPKNTTLIRSTVSTSSEVADAESVKLLRSDLTKKKGFPIKVVMETKVVAKLEKLKSKKLGIRVTCNGFHGTIPKGKSPSTVSASNAKCKADLRIKIWKWTF